MSSETMSVRPRRTRAALDLRSVLAAATVTTAAAVIAIGVAPRLAALIGGSVLLVAGFAVMAPCQLQMALTLSAVLKRRHPGEPGEEAVAIARPTSEFALGYLAFYAPIATVLGVIARLLGSWAWVAIIVGAAGSVVLGLAALGLGRPRWMARCRGPLWLLASGRASVQRPIRAGAAYGRYCASCCGPYVYALIVLAGGTRSVWLGAGLTTAYAVSMVAPTLLVAAIAPATSQRLAERAVSVSPTVERLTGLMLVGLGIVLMPAALAGAAA
jgi:cytochrome c biogenesis protein CcdA